jgi:hypothetical protein
MPRRSPYAIALTDEERALRDGYARANDADAAAGEEIDRLSRLQAAGLLT